MPKESCVYVEFTGDTSAERGKVQAALDEQYNDETMLGRLDVAPCWRVDRWQPVALVSLDRFGWSGRSRYPRLGSTPIRCRQRGV